MSLQERLLQDLKEAMKSGDAVKRNTIRAVRSAIRNAEIEAGHELSDQEVLEVITRQAKQRRDSMEQFRRGNRMDLVEAERQELEILETYLPRQLTDEEIAQRAKDVIAELGVSGMDGMGGVMRRLTQEMKGVADGRRISAIVRQLLTS